MPILPAPIYAPLLPFRNGHIQTIYPTLFRPQPQTLSRRERISTPDGDFLDIDWHASTAGDSDRLAVISHGLEGSSNKKYVLGMARYLAHQNWDVLCTNFRACSGVPNRLPRMYHSGQTDDLHTVLLHALSVKPYRMLALVGFSMGGNQILKYLGERRYPLPQEIRAAAVFSVPCDLQGSVGMLDKWYNTIYMRYFMKGLKEKIRIKAAMFPEIYTTEGLSSVRNFRPFDDQYTAPVHGFASASEYYQKSSSLQFLDGITVPTLLVQAQDDPFLSASCYPTACAERNPSLLLQLPRYGGHVGFVDMNRTNIYWSERRVGMFLHEIDRSLA